VVALDEARNEDPRVSGGGREEGMAVAVVVGEGEGEVWFGGGCAAVFQAGKQVRRDTRPKKVWFVVGMSLKLSLWADNTMLLSAGTRECPPGFGCLGLLTE